MAKCPSTEAGIPFVLWLAIKLSKCPAKDEAASLFALFRHWLARQFVALGREVDADALALHVLMRSQGVATLAGAFRDEDFIRREVEDLETWLEAQRLAGSRSAQPDPHQHP